MPFFSKKGSRLGKRNKKKKTDSIDESAVTCKLTGDEPSSIDKEAGSSDSSNVLQSQSSYISLDTSTLTPRVANIRPPNARSPLKSVDSAYSKSSDCMSIGSSKFFTAKSVVSPASNAPPASNASPASDASKRKGTPTSASKPPLSILTKNNKKELLVSHGSQKEMSVDYDVSPTLLYKFIEYKDWDEAMLRCEQAPEEARTWVVRFESDDSSDENSAYEDYEEKVVRWRMLPIHEAVVFNAPVKLITLLLKAYPAAISSVDDRKMTPLHLCCRNLRNVNIAQFLIVKNAETLTMTDYKGRTPLAVLKEYKDTHKVGKDKRNYDTLIKMVKDKMNITGDSGESSEEDNDSKSADEQSTFDDEQSTFDDKSTFDDRSTIDDTSTCDEELTVQDSGDKSTVSVYTAMLQKKSTEERSVLLGHSNSDDSLLDKSQSAAYILRNGSTESSSILKNKSAKPAAEKSIQNVQRIASNRSVKSPKSPKPSTPKGVPKDMPKVLSKDNSDDDVSLTIIPKENVKRNYIKRDIKQKKSAPKEVDYDLKPSPLIKLIERKMWGQAKIRCIDYPEEAATWMCRLQEVKDKSKGKTEVKWKILPIHSAIVLQAPVEMIEALVDAHPQGLRKGDDRKMLPLHMAFRLGASPEITAILVDSYPDALKKKDSKGHTPLHILKAYKRKFVKERAIRKQSKKSAPPPPDSLMDKNRKKLIKFYLSGRTYGDDDDVTLAAFDSDDEDSNFSADDDSTIIFHEEEDYAYDKLFYRNMFTDFGSLAKRGISHIPNMVRDTLACRS